MSDLEEKIRDAAGNYPIEIARNAYIEGANFVRELMQGERLNEIGDATQIIVTALVLSYQENEKLRDNLAVAVDSIETAVRYLDSCGYGRKMADREPEDYMIEDFRQALSKIKGGAE